MSGADPWTGSNSEGLAPVGSMFADGAMPMLPINAADRSVSRSPNRLLPTMTSNRAGSRTSRASSASRCMVSTATSGYSAATSRTTSSQNGIAYMIPFDLVALVSLPCRERASSSA